MRFGRGFFGWVFVRFGRFYFSYFYYDCVFMVSDIGFLFFVNFIF